MDAYAVGPRYGMGFGCGGARTEISPARKFAYRGYGRMTGIQFVTSVARMSVRPGSCAVGSVTEPTCPNGANGCTPEAPPEVSASAESNVCMKYGAESKPSRLSGEGPAASWCCPSR